MSRRAAAVSAEVAALLLAGVMALSTLRRRQHESSRQARDEPSQGDSFLAEREVPKSGSTASASGQADKGHLDDEAVADDLNQVEHGGVPPPDGHDDATEQGTDTRLGRVQSDSVGDSKAPEHSPDAPRVTRAKALIRRCLTATWVYTRQGFVPAVWVLLVLAIAPATYGWLHRPDTSVPQPSAPSIEVDFSQSHPALSPITVGVRLLRDDPSSDGDGSMVTLAIDLSGEGFSHAGWEVYADVPAGVKVSEPQNGRHPYTSDGTAYAYINPGPQRDGKYTALLDWHSLTSGPLQVTGANMVAAFPSVTVRNQTQNESASVPTPTVTVNRALAPGSDFTYQAGLPPNRFVGVEWQWRPVTGHVNEPLLVDALNVEAKSASLDGQAHVAEFYSGIAFGVAFAAFIACVVEFVKADRRKQDLGQRVPGEAAAATASPPGQTPSDP